jgi:hypothetical protein
VNSYLWGKTNMSCATAAITAHFDTLRWSLWPSFATTKGALVGSYHWRWTQRWDDSGKEHLSNENGTTTIRSERFWIIAHWILIVVGF